MARSLIVEILGDAKQFGAELDKAAGKTRSFGKAAGVAGLALAGGLAYGLEKSVKAAENMQVSTAKMDAAFKSAGVNINKFTGQINAAESSGRNLGFSNIDIRDSLGGLVVATHSGTAAIKDLGVAEDLARFKHISLSDASKILTSAMAGSTRAARQLGLTVSSTTTATTQASQAYKAQEAQIKASFPTTSKMTAAQKAMETQELNSLQTKYAAIKAQAQLTDKQATAAKVVDLVSEKLHGQAQAFADTAQGGMAKMKAQTEALQENLGSALLPALVSVTGALASLTGWLAQHTTIAKLAIIALGTLAATLIGVSVATKLQTAAMGLAKVATAAWTAGQWLLNAALDANPIGIVVVAIGALVAAIVVAWQHSQTFRNIVRETWGDIRAAIVAAVDFLKPFVVGMLNAWEAEFGIVKSVAVHVFDGVKVAWNATLGPVINWAIGLIKDVIHWIQTLIGWAQKAWDWVNKLASPMGKGHKVAPGKPPVAPPGTPGMAAGGIVMGPTLAVVGEAGPEAVIPLDKMGNMGGITVNMNGPVFGDKRAVADELAHEIRNALVRIGMREPTIFSRPGVVA